MYVRAPYFFTIFLILVLSNLGKAQVFQYASVTDELLQNPPNEEWLSWRGTPRSWGYSPLNQINTEKIIRVRLSYI